MVAQCTVWGSVSLGWHLPILPYSVSSTFLEGYFSIFTVGASAITSVRDAARAVLRVFNLWHRIYYGVAMRGLE